MGAYLVEALLIPTENYQKIWGINAGRICFVLYGGLFPPWTYKHRSGIASHVIRLQADYGKGDDLHTDI